MRITYFVRSYVSLQLDYLGVIYVHGGFKLKKFVFMGYIIVNQQYKLSHIIE